MLLKIYLYRQKLQISSQISTKTVCPYIIGLFDDYAWIGVQTN